MENCNTILLIYHHVQETQIIKKTVEFGNFTCICAETCMNAKELCKNNFPDVILCEIAAARNDGKSLFHYIRSQRPQTIINILLPENNKELILEAMSYGINNYLIQPLTPSDIGQYLTNINQALRTIPQSNIVNTITTFKHYTKTLGNSLFTVYETTEGLMKDMNPALSYCYIGIHLGLEELLINAIEHGNLNISYDEKSRAIEDGTFDNLLTSRLNDSKYACRKVTVAFNQVLEYDEWIISDEGDGFDIRTIPTVMDDESLKQLHGRGIQITKFQFDEIEYSEDGKTVRVRKYVPIC